MSQVASVGEGNFQTEVVESDHTVVVDFWAEWCEPCKMLAPLLDKVASRFEGRIKVVKCNVEENKEIAEKYAIYSIPNLVFFRDGQVIDQAVGYMAEAQLADKVTEVIGS